MATVQPLSKPSKHLSLELEEAREEINAAVDQIAKRHGLPCYLTEPLVADVLNRLRDGKRKEIDHARRAYELQVRAYESEASEKGEEEG